MIHPIWKEFSVYLGPREVQSVDYIIAYKQGESLTTIYSGRAYAKPNSNKIEAVINDVCSDWLSNSLPNLAEGFSRQDLPVEFSINQVTAMGQYVNLGQVQFINDWSYDPDFIAEIQGLAHPVNGRIDSRQWLLWTGLNVSEVEADVILKNGESFKVFIPVEIAADFNADFNADFAKILKVAGSGTAVFSPSQWGDVSSVVINGNQYDIINSCSRYVLYYLNAHGGWDSLLIEGAASEQDKLTRHTMTKAGVYGREKSNYLNEIEKSITLHTSWLSDEQSLRMHHLLNSTDVYLHDLEKNSILPVILEGSSTPYKTFKGEGGKLVNYTIEVTIAQTRMRR